MIDPRKGLLVFGGPYSNLQATEAMRQEAERRSIPPSNVICTGDVVAYAAEPEETVQLVRDWGIQVVAGNCEEQLAEGLPDCGCGFEEGSVCDLLSRGWYPYARSHTSQSSRDWMGGLPRRIDVTFAGLKLCVIHGGATENNRFLFASERGKLEQEFEAACQPTPCDVVLAGHSGIPFIAPLNRGVWVNAGVVGLPANDGTSNVWYVVLEATEDGVDIRLNSLSYDYMSAAAQMRRAGHANGYARTLVTGIWPSHDVLPASEHEATGVALEPANHSVQCLTTVG